MSDGAVALLSGGLDSAVATALWLSQQRPVVQCLWFDYGQHAAAPELRAAERFCTARQLPLLEVPLPWLQVLAQRHGSALVTRPEELPAASAAAPGDAASAAAVWVPARNAVFVAIGAAHAEALGAAVVLAGFNREEAATFPDNSPGFVAAGSRLLRYGTRGGVRVEGPCLDLDKRGIVAAARRLGIGPEDVWSCYRGGERPCGRCESCARSARAWDG